MRTSVKPSLYPPLPFHLLRLVIFVSSLTVAIILADFAYHLHSSGYKFPWAFLILIISAVLSLVNLILTTIVHCFYGLSPRLSMGLNGILLVLWAISLGLLAWCMSHTILTTCTATYWATSSGISVCRTYKALFAFTALGVASYIASIALDIVVRIRQTRLGNYDPMAVSESHHMLSGIGAGNAKLHDRSSSALSSPFDPNNHVTTPAGGGYSTDEHHPFSAHMDDNDDDIYHAVPAPGRGGHARTLSEDSDVGNPYYSDRGMGHTRYDPGAYR
ncbi:hypothetical protein ASPZODRAFT_99595 [Penicilliopsis zonata CBS 506.65]|uniref:MARVEL domain-containing protein n=1 Tax=Penicilliopsis zonata CBS 506.65 TaxID=1073090 RepID=A0A1L9SE67_9EURO|nr:hypothetical protein ASPZODRAFT_99595 [Penicilliopsis zonata CBS 506.65]OJJ45479.1 hypothetical protein ASPZODRAFT_99595 [Penicilliopsis zonata CBS 506.65]